MAEDKPTSYTYRVLRPILPTAEQFAANEAEVRFEVLGDFGARTPDAACELAGHGAIDATQVPREGVSVGLVAIPLKSWHERMVGAKPQLVFEVVKPPTAIEATAGPVDPDPPPES
jgi:hypothetical protein